MRMSNTFLKQVILCQYLIRKNSELVMLPTSFSFAEKDHPRETQHTCTSKVFCNDWTCLIIAITTIVIGCYIRMIHKYAFVMTVRAK